VVLVSSSFVLLQPTDPGYSIYARTKRQAEEAARTFCNEHGLSLLSLRLAALYGPDPAMRKHQPFLYEVVSRAAAHRDVVLRGSREARRNYIHIRDGAEAIVRSIEAGLEGTYLCAALAATSYGEIARAAARAVGAPSRVVFEPDLPDTPDILCPIDPTLYETLGWYPEVTLDEGVGELARLLAPASDAKEVT
jgi:nucleoside-diphosphate-sugar epimerase